MGQRSTHQHNNIHLSRLVYRIAPQGNDRAFTSPCACLQRFALAKGKQKCGEAFAQNMPLCDVAQWSQAHMI